MSEFGPSPGEEAEKEATGISLAEEIAELRSRARTDEDFQAIMQKISELKGVFRPTSEGKLSGEVSEQMKKAEEIMGADFFGPEQVQSAFLDQVEISEVPSIPFSSEDLEKAKELGQMLILRQPLTMKQIGEALGDKVKDEGKVFYDTDWYKEEKFYTEEAAGAGWALVSKEVVPNSTDKNYLDQTDLLVDYLKDHVFKGVDLPPVYQVAIDEYLAKRTDIATTMSSDWQKAAEMLEGLKITELTRQSPSEALYDLVAYFQNNDERLLSNKYSWTRRRHSDGFLVCVGGFKSDGVRVGGDGPGSSYSNLGVSFSRSL